jgi:hypothetical protein
MELKDVPEFFEVCILLFLISFVAVWLNVAHYLLGRARRIFDSKDGNFRFVSAVCG